MNFKDQIEHELSKQSWGVVLVDTISEWWEDEHWEIQWKHPKGLKLYVQFLVDPMDVSSIWAVIVKNHLENNGITISCLSRSKRKFNIKLKAFVSDIETYRLTL